MQNYQTIPILLILLVIYFVSILLVKFKKITLFNQRRFWNIVLLITFLGSGVLGLILAISLDQKINLPWYLQFLRLHVKFGTAMSLVSIFHLLWHLPYYKTILKKK
jgi:spermidine synthase